MRAKASVAIAVAGLAAVLAPPAPAGAEPHVLLPTHTAQLHLRGRGGYGISLFAVELPKPHKSLISLSASKQVKGHAFDFDSSSYSVAGAVSAKRIRANLGPYGRVFLRFEPSGPAKEGVFPGCHGTANTTQRGVFVGTIRFRGDGGFTEVDAERAKGSVRTQGSYVCGGGGGALPHQSRGKKVEEVSLNAATPHHALDFSADVRPGQEAFPGFPAVEYRASSIQACGRVVVSRSVSVGGPASLFVFDRPLTSATVTPPAPFSGSGAFSRDPLSGATSWTGTLAVSFPGLDAALTGEAFDADLKRQFVDPSVGVLYLTVARCPSRR